ncbi:MAG: type II toxin-antitoxin system HicB family antitoxin [Alkalilacustris sp.]
MKAYRGYTATVRFDDDALLFHGEVVGLRDVISFQARTAEELVRAFHDSVDDYLAWCAEDGVAPQKPYSGKLAFRTTPEHHRLIASAAAAQGQSINQWMDDRLAEAARRVLAEATTVGGRR